MRERNNQFVVGNIFIGVYEAEEEADQPREAPLDLFGEHKSFFTLHALECLKSTRAQDS
jgi:hypothetical protein